MAGVRRSSRGSTGSVDEKKDEDAAAASAAKPEDKPEPAGRKRKAAPKKKAPAPKKKAAPRKKKATLVEKETSAEDADKKDDAAENEEEAAEEKEKEKEEPKEAEKESGNEKPDDKEEAEPESEKAEDKEEAEPESEKAEDKEEPESEKAEDKAEPEPEPEKAEDAPAKEEGEKEAEDPPEKAKAAPAKKKAAPRKKRGAAADKKKAGEEAGKEEKAETGNDVEEKSAGKEAEPEKPVVGRRTRRFNPRTKEIEAETKNSEEDPKEEEASKDKTEEEEDKEAKEEGKSPEREEEEEAPTKPKRGTRKRAAPAPAPAPKKKPAPRRKKVEKDVEAEPEVAAAAIDPPATDVAYAAAAAPGKGWSNGDIQSMALFPHSRAGKMQLYGNERRWLNVASSWTRIGDGSEFDAVHSASKSGVSLVKDPEEEASTVKALIAQLCEFLYNQGWATGTGGGCSIRIKDASGKWRVFVAPSGIQKEDMVGLDVFELDMDRKVVAAPVTPNLRQSACTPLWYVVYKHRSTAQCVMHTHSMNAQLATLLDTTEQAPHLEITHLEMLKGVGHHSYDDVLQVPIIDNRPSEDLLAAQLEQALVKYPKANAVLVRRHGLYVWGDSWEQAKTQCESFDYLFEAAIKMKQFGIDPAKLPPSGTYRVAEEGTAMDVEPEAAAAKEDRNDDPQAKPAQKEEASTGFNLASKADNALDMTVSPIPLVPRQCKIVLLDIEGCTTSISSVKEGLFPYIVANVDDYVSKQSTKNAKDLYDQLKADIESSAPADAKLDLVAALGKKGNAKDGVIACVKAMVEADIKATGLKKLQGEMWDAGYKSGDLKGHVYDDVPVMLNWCQSQDVKVHIYSSGSVHAQKLLFGHSNKGDLLAHLSEHFDTSTAGNKKEASSYTKIAEILKVKPADIMFVSDAEAELVAAKEAGIGHIVMSIRPGNAPLTDVGRSFPSVQSLLQLCGN